MRPFTWGTVTATGPLRVKLDGDTTALPVTLDSLVIPESLFVGDRVYCGLANKRVIIHGRSGGERLLAGPRLFDLRPALATAGKGVWYSDLNPADSNPYAPLHGWRLVSGEVMLFGLIRTLTAVNVGDVLFRLPDELWPLTSKPFFTEYNNNVARVVVNIDGTVTAGSAMSSGVYLDFAGVAYNNNAGLARHAMVLNSAQGWQPYGAPYGPPAYVADDGYGRRFWEGVVKGGAMGTTIASLAANPGIVSGVGATHLMAQPESTGFSRMDANTGGLTRATISGGLATSAQMSLDARILTDAYAAAATPVYFVSGSNYNASAWASAVVSRMGDGAIKLAGLVIANVAGSVFARIPISMAPKHQLLWFVESTDGIGRVDVKPDGSIILSVGSTASGNFNSFESLQWMPAETWDRYWGRL